MRCKLKRVAIAVLAVMLCLTVAPAWAASEPETSARPQNAFEIYRQGALKYIVGEAGATPVTVASILREVHTGAGFTIELCDADGTALALTASATTGQQLISKDTNGKIGDRATLVLFGDVTGDGTVNIADVVLTLNALQNKVSLVGAHQLAADRNRNGRIEMSDVLSVMRIMRWAEPAPEPSTIENFTVQTDTSAYTDPRASVTVLQTSGDAVSAVRVRVWREGDTTTEKTFSAERNGSAWRASFTWAGNFAEPGVYCIDARAVNKEGVSTSVGQLTVQVAQSAIDGTQIMGKSACTVAQLVNLQKSYGWNDEWYDGMTVEQFCQMYYDICEKEGVRAEVAYAQMIHETGGLGYGGLVIREQHNFAGLGASGEVAQSDKRKANHRYTAEGRDAGIAFTTVENGIKSHVHHLKGYATKDALVLEKAPEYDRYGAGGIGVAPLVEQLGQTWAVSARYSAAVLDLMDRILAQSVPASAD